MKTIHSAIPLLLLLVLAPCALCQGHIKDSNHEAYGKKCPALHSADPATLLQYLNDNKPTPQNAICVTWAIYGVGDARYEPAIPALVNLLDFARQIITGTWDHLPGSAYPAVEALEDIGRPSLPALLATMKAPAASPTAQTNALEAWLIIYRTSDRQSHGFAALRREANATTDDSVKKRLEDILQYGLKHWCQDGTPGAKCRQAAQDGIDR
ncbi:MAG TPA: hypothetical protein VN661_07560 [Candidatus Acidoferrales bacterium]|nr:hypothetical protein [Candidatus Acidoferrales bacterium]